MNTVEIIITAVIAIAVIAAAIVIIRRKKKGRCSCGCEGCTMNCAYKGKQ